MWTKLSADKKSELMKAYKKGGFSYRDMIDDYNTSYEKFDLGGETNNKTVGEFKFEQAPGNTIPQSELNINAPYSTQNSNITNNDYININTEYESKDPKDWTQEDYKQYDFNRRQGIVNSTENFNKIFNQKAKGYEFSNPDWNAKEQVRKIHSMKSEMSK